mmetsp:Transcript_1522/g.2153  ORF Transcript_1522/g.2153 Transcript_1522/m.2153 type:complete len:150 (-) Transcript_1522:34-483(-)
MSTNYLSVKRRYFANLGIHPATNLNSSPPSPPSHSFPLISSNSSDSSDQAQDLFLSVSDIFSDEQSDESSSSIDNFEIQLDDIFSFEEENVLPFSTSVPIEIPSALSPKTKPKAKKEFVPPHLLVSRSLYSSLGDYKYQKNRASAKKAF